MRTHVVHFTAPINSYTCGQLIDKCSQAIHQGALADAEDASLVMRFCDLILTDEVRSQDGLFLLRRALGNRHATPQVWAFVKDHWGEITTRFPSSTVSRLFDGIRGIADPALAAEVVAFLEAHPLDHGTTSIRQHVERMWVTVAVARRVPAELAAAFPLSRALHVEELAGTTFAESIGERGSTVWREAVRTVLWCLAFPIRPKSALARLHRWRWLNEPYRVSIALLEVRGANTES